LTNRFVLGIRNAMQTRVTVAIIPAAVVLTLLGACRRPNVPPIELHTTLAPGATLVQEYADNRFFEGPTWSPTEVKLYFTAFGEHGQQLLRLEHTGHVTVWMDRTEGVNGTFLAQDGRLLAAQTYGHRVLALPPGGIRPAEVVTLAADPAWNQPNDVCQSPTGHIYFSDPDFKTRTKSGVYHLAPDGRVGKVISDMTLPNGLVVSNDGRSLYVADSHEKHWRAYPIGEDGSLGAGRVFFNPDVPDQADPDGMTIDEHGRLYFTGRGGVWVVRPDGTMLEFIPVPEFCSNLTFGGPDGRTLYLTCKHKVYSLAMAVRGGPSGGHW